MPADRHRGTRHEVSNDDTVTAESTETVWPAVSLTDAWFRGHDGGGDRHVDGVRPRIARRGRSRAVVGDHANGPGGLVDTGGGERDRLQGRRVLGRRSAAGQGQHASRSNCRVMPFWLVKLSVSPDWKLVIVIEAPVISVSLEVTVTPESTATAEPPSVKVWPVLPEVVTTGAAIATLTLSAAELLVSALSVATIESRSGGGVRARGGERDRLQGRR